jgi:AraC family transcriptional regulator of adaptative response/methylated-DNA-[protein]-cysteine methyltransferase
LFIGEIKPSLSLKDRKYRVLYHPEAGNFVSTTEKEIMKPKKISFKDMGNDVRDTAFARSLMNKVALKKRIGNTRLAKSNRSFVVTQWVNADNSLMISARYTDTVFGKVLIGSTEKGVCFMGFVNDNYEQALMDLKRKFPANPLNGESNIYQNEAIDRLNHSEDELPVHLHLKGTAFQFNIWEKLLLVPFGGLTTYSELGGTVKNARAVGSAVGANPVCYIVPCHRVIRTDGSFDGFYWGTELKEKILTYEAITFINEIIAKGLSNSL